MSDKNLMQQLLNLTFILLVSVFFTACGGSSTDSTTPQGTAIDKLVAFANLTFDFFLVLPYSSLLVQGII